MVVILIFVGEIYARSISFDCQYHSAICCACEQLGVAVQFVPYATAATLDFFALADVAIAEKLLGQKL